MAYRLAASPRLQALIAAVKHSPIVVRLAQWPFTAAEWARIRNSPEVDACVLAWIASHVPPSRRKHRVFM
jgi:hypothetical protein